MVDQEQGRGRRSSASLSNERMKLWLLIDRSGSMSSLGEAVVEGTNHFLEEQRSRPGRCRVTLAQFDSVEPLHISIDARRIERVRPMTLADYQPRSMTPLYDAIGRLMYRADRRMLSREHRGRASEDQTVVIVSDGLENCSSNYTCERIRELINRRREAGWTFAYLGANQDAYAVGASLSIPEGNVSSWEATDEGTRRAYRSVSRAIVERRGMSQAQRRENRDDFFHGVREAENDE